MSSSSSRPELNAADVVKDADISRPTAEVLPSILAVAKKLIEADAYAIWRVFQSEHRWVIVASEGLSSDYILQTLPQPTSPALPTSSFFPDVTKEPSLRHRQEIYAKEGILGLLAVPMHIDDEVGGSITFYFRQPAHLTDEQLRLAGSIADLAAAAVRAADLYESQLATKSRLDFLADAGSILSSSLEYETTLAAVARLAVPRIADWCGVDIVQENGAVKRFAYSHVNPEKLKIIEHMQQHFPPELRHDRGLGRVLTTGKAELYAEVTDEVLKSVARSEEHLALLRELGMTSAILVPLNVRERTIGVITLVNSESSKRFDDNDLQLAKDLARRAAVAVDNARLFRDSSEALALLDSMLANAPVGFCFFDREHRIIRANRLLADLAGGPLESQRGKTLQEMVVGDSNIAKMDEMIERVFNTGEPVLNVEIRSGAKSKALERHWLSGYYPIMAKSGEVGWVGAILMEITDRKAAEAALRNTEKLAATGRMAATIAHEINNPLESVTNLIYIIRKSLPADDKLQDYLGLADRELARVSHIARQTLGFYRDVSAPEELNFAEIVNEALALFQNAISARNINVVRHFENTPALYGARGEIRQVFTNLFSNAIDAMRHGGELAIDVGVETNGDVCVKVCDEGEGIPDELLERIFEAFFTTKKDVGTGLGLWVTRDLISRNHGRILVESSTATENHGTTFTLLFEPAAKP